MRCRRLIFLCCLAQTLAGPVGAASALAIAEEAGLLAVLQGGGAAEKEAACVRLQVVGTVRAVPALQALLGDPELSHAARLALESLPVPEAGLALVSALETTTGLERLGVVGSLAVRREAAAAPALIRLLAIQGGGESLADAELAAAVAAALGVCGGDEALAALEFHWPTAREPVRGALGDALLQRAHGFLALGESARALRLGEAIFRVETGWPRRSAAYVVILHASGPRAGGLLAAALSGPAGPEQAAALQVLSELPGREVTDSLARVLPSLPATVQEAVLKGWLRRPDPPGRSVVRPLIENGPMALRQTAVRALGRVGEAEDVPGLIEWAAAPGGLQSAAREALVELRAPGCAARLRALLREERIALRVEAARALGRRGDRTAVPDLLILAASEVTESRSAAWRALAQAAGEEHLEAMLAAVQHATDSGQRGEAARAVALALERLQPADESPALREWARLAAHGAPVVREALLAAGGTLASPLVRGVIRTALSDTEARVRGAAVRAAAAGNDAALLPDLLRIATDPRATEYDGLATAACVRWVTRADNRGAALPRIEVWRALAAAPLRFHQKRLLLQGLAAGRSEEELEIGERYLADAECWSEAVAAVAGIAGRLPYSTRLAELLQLLSGCALDPELRRTVESALRTVEGKRAAGPPDAPIRGGAAPAPRAAPSGR